MTSINTFGVAAHQISKIFCSSKLSPYFQSSHQTERSVVIQGSSAHKAVGHILLASVAQIMVDPYYRTIEGFAMLVEKDWLSFRYPFFGVFMIPWKFSFLDTSGRAKDTGHRLWEMFINLLYVLLLQHPEEFQYNAYFLEWIYEESTTYACAHSQLNDPRERFATFCRDHGKAGPSAWDFLIATPTDFLNPFYSGELYSSEEDGYLKWVWTGFSPRC